MDYLGNNWGVVGRDKLQVIPGFSGLRGTYLYVVVQSLWTSIQPNSTHSRTQVKRRHAGQDEKPLALGIVVTTNLPSNVQQLFLLLPY